MAKHRASPIGFDEHGNPAYRTRDGVVIPREEEIPPVVQSLLLEGYWWVAEDTVSTVFEWLRAHPEFHWTVEKKTGYTFFTVSLPSSYWLEHHD